MRAVYSQIIGRSGQTVLDRAVRGERYLFPTGSKRRQGPQATLFLVWANLCLGLRKWYVAFSSNVTITAMRSRFSGPDLPGSHCFQLAFY